MSKIDFSKPVKTASGRPVRVLCTDAEGSWPVVGLILYDTGEPSIQAWDLHGKLKGANSARGGADLIGEPVREYKWFNLYSNEAGMAFDTKQESVIAGERQMLALVKVTFEDGQPVSACLEPA